VLAWSAAAVVLVARGLLVALPTRGSAVAARPGPVLAAGSDAAEGAPTEAADDPLPTLADAPFGPTPEATAMSSTGAGAEDIPTAATSTAARTPSPIPAAPTTGAPARPEAQLDASTADRRSRGPGDLSLSWTPAAGLACGGEWTAELHASTGGAQVSRVIAVSGRGPAVMLHQDGDDWSGELTGLPTNRTVTVTVFADGPVRPASVRLTVDC
jgi:hypothetical protein